MKDHIDGLILLTNGGHSPHARIQVNDIPGSNRVVGDQYDDTLAVVG